MDIYNSVVKARGGDGQRLGGGGENGGRGDM